jgi:peptide/nickel transport system ATP-binding protein
VGAILTRPLQHFGIVRGAEAGREVARLLELVRLPPSYTSRFPHQLSGGEKQRVGIARALASRPDFIICDEAVSALDVSVQAAILNLLAELRRDLGLTLMFISHDMGVIGHISDRIAVMYGGAVMELGPARAILAPPYHPYTEALLSAVPAIGRGRTERIQLPGEQGAVHAGSGCRFALRCHRRIGAICSDQAPPWREIAGKDGAHQIRCHIPIEGLVRIEAEQAT